MLWISLGCFFLALIVFPIYIYHGWSLLLVTLWLGVHLAGMALAVIAALRYPHDRFRAVDLLLLNAGLAIGALQALLEVGKPMAESVVKPEAEPKTEGERGADD